MQICWTAIIQSVKQEGDFQHDPSFPELGGCCISNSYSAFDVDHCTPASSCASRPTPQILGKANTLIVCIDLGIHRDSFHQCLNVEPYALSGEPMRMQHKHKKPNSATPNLPPSPTDTRPTKRASRLFLLLLGCTLDLRRTSESLLSVLALLACIHFVSISLHFTHIHVQKGRDVRCCLEGFSILLANPTRTNL